VDDLADHGLRRPSGLAVRARAAVLHPARPELSVPIGPPLRGRPRHLEPLSRPSDRPAVINDQLPDPEPSLRRQSSISVHDEDLLVCEMGAFSSSTSRQEVLVVQQVISASRRKRSTNLPGQYI
jgi:hypothetical protein